MMTPARFLAALLCLGLLGAAAPAPYYGWAHSGSIFILTTPEGANLPAAASLDDFPLLVRLHKDSFDFAQAKADGADLRFSAADGKPLAYQIEQWDPAGGSASVWVRIPNVKGNARQELKLHWGKPDAASESSGAAVFNDANGYLSVWHMTAPVKDEVGTLESKDVGTTPAAGMIGAARHFAGKQGIFGGDKIPNYPSGAGAHSTQAWFRAEVPNSTIIGWGNEPGGRGTKVRMLFRSPPHVRIDSNFSDVRGKPGGVTLGEWVQVGHTYDGREGRIYINGQLDGSATPKLAINSPARLWLGGWYNNFDFVGDLDEVRVSKVARSADWVKLEYENQKPLQTLVGPVVRAGDELSVSPAELTVSEGKTATVSARAGGAQKVYWVLKRDGAETVVATDRFDFTLDAGRVTGDASATLQFRAVYATEVKTRDVAVTIREAIPEPVFTLNAPPAWDGRATIELTPQVTNLAQMRAAGAGDLHYAWDVSGMAVIKDVAPGKLVLTRAQNSGKLTVTATVDNGGKPVTRTAEVAVTEPKRDPWVARAPATDEKPVDNQFYARDDQDEGTLHYNGTLDAAADAVFLKVYADGRPYKDESQKPGADKAYAFAVKLKPGLVKYKVEFGTGAGAAAKVLHTADNLVCGDAYVIQGQSNALATDTREEAPLYTSEWIRSYGGPTPGAKAPPAANLWCNPVWKARKGERAELGYWGMELAKRLVDGQRVPVCIFNGAVGGTRIDQHQRSAADPEDLTTIYGRLLWRVRQAKLTHGVRGVLWHQGESDQGADGPTGGFGWEAYQRLFVELSAAWKTDFPNVRHYHVFQIWPKSCSMGVDGSDNALREVQRTLPALYSNMGVMSTLGIRPPGGCHYPLVGWAEFARLIYPLIERDHYGRTFAEPITPPNLVRARYVTDKRDAVALEFDQPVAWDDKLAGQFYLDGARGLVASGAAAGNALVLKLAAPATATAVSYLDSKAWSQDTLLVGTNGIAALTFYNVPIQPPKP